MSDEQMDSFKLEKQNILVLTSEKHVTHFSQRSTVTYSLEPRL